MTNKIKIQFIIFIVGTIIISSCKIDVEPEPPEIRIESPINEDTVSNIISISGIASDNVNVVQVKFGEGDFIEALGTTTWTIDVDTRLYNDGQTEIIAKATSDTWDVVQATSSVNVENIDPLVGTWDWVSGVGYGYIIFHPSGVYDESNGIIGASWSYEWQRESESVITIKRQTAGPLSITATITNNDDLKLEWNVYGTLNTAYYKRR